MTAPEPSFGRHVRPMPWVVAAVAVASGVFVLIETAPVGVDAWDVLETVVGWAFVGSGLLAWQRRPANRMGPLLIAAGLVYLVGRVLRQFNVSIAFTGGIIVGDAWTVFFAWVLLAFPYGTLATTFDRLVLLIFAVVVGPIEFAWLLFWEPPEGPGNALLAWSNARVASNIDTFQRYTIVIGSVALAIALSLRWLSASTALRRILAPVLVGALSLMLGAVLTVLDKFEITAPTLRKVVLLALIAVPVAVVAGLARARLARSGVAELLVQLRGNPAPADLRQPLARALGDPSLELAYWLPKVGQYVDAEGRPVTLPVATPGRVTTRIDRDGVQVAALTHDASLREEPELLDAVAAAAAIALENGRLHAELNARLEELQASRARVIEAGQAERKRLARNLHDGTQQRLVALSVELALLERKLGADAEASTRIGQVKTEIAASLAELRDIAQGLHPSLLTLHGLPAALKSIAARAPVPVDLDVVVEGRLPEPVEVAAYYVVSESLANIGKHAHASKVIIEVAQSDVEIVVEVIDDGVGGADRERGSGLHGLADRVESLGGEFAVSTPPGGGTRVAARIPCVR